MPRNKSQVQNYAKKASQPSTSKSVTKQAYMSPSTPKTPRNENTTTDSSSSKSLSRKKKRFKVGTRVNREIYKLQRTFQLLIPKLPFSRLVREVLQQFGSQKRITKTALTALQESAESYLLSTFQFTNILCMHRDRKTLHPKDFKVREILMDGMYAL